MNEDDTFAALKKWTYTEMVEWVATQPVHMSWIRLKQEMNNRGWCPKKFMELRQQEIEEKELFR